MGRAWRLALSIARSNFVKPGQVCRSSRLKTRETWSRCWTTAKQVVTTGKTFLAKVWDADTGEEKFVLPGPGGRSPLGPEWGLAVSIGPDGKLLAVIDPEFQGITIWDLP